MNGRPSGLPASSHRIDEKVLLDRLCGSPYIDLHRLAYTWCDGVLTLRGRVPSYFLKQIAQAIAASVAGVAAVDNQLEVVQPVQSPQQ